MKIRIASSLVVAGLLLNATQTFAATGKEVYESTCAACHATGAAGAPKFGDKAAWAPRIKDMKAMQTSALKGKNVMPAKGGNSSLPDADVLAAVEYMVSHSR